jgi:hypothetical protein
LLLSQCKWLRLLAPRVSFIAQFG